ncbi:MAG TPA: hypothetical protein VNO32_51445 [Candidatus Acidoferrum sp.]|nr:hypothetical protein [Candidatus Acidoferrum sp.]
MKTRREFLATAVAGAASLAASSGQTRATPAGLSIVDEAGRRDRAFSDSGSGGRDMVDKGEDPRITRARLSGPEHVTKDATVAEMAADHDRFGQRNERVGLYTGKRKQNR